MRWRSRERSASCGAYQQKRKFHMRYIFRLHWLLGLAFLAACARSDDVGVCEDTADCDVAAQIVEESGRDASSMDPSDPAPRPTAWGARSLGFDAYALAADPARR